MSGSDSTVMFVDAVGIVAPDITDWDDFKSVVEESREIVIEQAIDPQAQMLPAAVRRRATQHVKLAVQAAHQAVVSSAVPASQLATVFASSENDGLITDNICMALLEPQPMISPTRFHHSVNNAAAGSWGITHQLKRFSTSVLGYDGPAAVGLMEALGLLQSELSQVLLVVHDACAPPRLHKLRPWIASFACAFVLSRQASHASIAALGIEPVAAENKITQLSHRSLEALREGNPSASMLPVLHALANPRKTEVCLPYVDDCHLCVEIHTC